MSGAPLQEEGGPLWYQRWLHRHMGSPEIQPRKPRDADYELLRRVLDWEWAYEGDPGVLKSRDGNLVVLGQALHGKRAGVHADVYPNGVVYLGVKLDGPRLYQLQIIKVGPGQGSGALVRSDGKVDLAVSLKDGTSRLYRFKVIYVA